MREHKEGIDECVHSINKCDNCSEKSKTGNQIEQIKRNIHESNIIICNKCTLSSYGTNKLSTHLQDKHQSCKRCIHFGAGHCDTVNCRFHRIFLYVKSLTDALALPGAVLQTLTLLLAKKLMQIGNTDVCGQLCWPKAIHFYLRGHSSWQMLCLYQQNGVPTSEFMKRNPCSASYLVYYVEY